MAIIIEYDQATGVGDQYASIYTLWGVYNKLKKLTNSTILVYCNSKTSHYFGNQLPGIGFYSKIFDYSFLDEIIFNTSIPLYFNHKRYWHSQYFSFYSDNNIDDELLNSINFNYIGHTTLYDLEDSYNPYRIQPLINVNLLPTNDNSIKPFIIFHLRFNDGWRYKNDKENFHKTYSHIQSIANTYPNHQVIIGGRNEVTEALDIVKCSYIFKTEQKTKNIEEDVISYGRDMVFFSFADKIFAYCHWRSNFLTYSILHNKLQKSYKELIEKI